MVINLKYNNLIIANTVIVDERFRSNLSNTKLVPMFCSGIFVENSQVSFYGKKAGSCLNCGKMGHIPNGIFNLLVIL